MSSYLLSENRLMNENVHVRYNKCTSTYPVADLSAGAFVEDIDV